MNDTAEKTDRQRIRALERQLLLVGWMAAIALGTLIGQTVFPLLRHLPALVGSA